MASEPIPAGPVHSGPLPGEGEQSPASQPTLTDAAAIYTENCAACHGADGAGGGEMGPALADMGVEVPDMSAEGFYMDRTPTELYTMITNGTMTSGGMMPPWRDSLSEAQRWSVTYYLYTLGDGETLLADGEAIYEETFAECVDEEALNDAQVTSALTADQIAEEYLAECEAAADLSDGDLNAAALYALNKNVDNASTASSAPPISEGDQLPADHPPMGESAAPAEGELPADHPPVGEAPAEGELPADHPPVGEGDAVAEEAPAEEEPAVIARGDVTGAITIGETGDPVPEGTEVTLHGYVVNDMSGVDEFVTKTATTAADGSYIFTDVQFDIPSSAYAVSMDYGGLEFSNGALINPGENGELHLPITVYEGTSDASAITIEQFNVIAEPVGDDLMVVTQFIGFNNASDQVYFSPERGASIEVTIPPNAENIEFQNNQQLGVRYIREGNTLKDTFYVYPGEHALVFRYMVPVSGAMELDLPLMYTAEEVNVLVPEGMALRGADNYTLGEAQQLSDGVTFDVYTATNVTDGVAFTIRQNVDVGSIVRTAVIAVSIIGGLSLIGYAFIIRGGFGSDDPDTARIGYNGSTLQQISDLDQAFAAGKLNRIEYEEKRAVLKLTLAEEG
jgi:mono/diheme cytochrome c family protein